MRLLFTTTMLGLLSGCSGEPRHAVTVQPLEIHEHHYKGGHVEVGMMEAQVWKQVHGFSTNPAVDGPYLAIIDDPEENLIRLAFEKTEAGPAGWLEIVMSNQTVVQIRKWPIQPR